LACTDNLKEIAKMNAVSSQPINEVENYLLKYTDSSNLKDDHVRTFNAGLMHISIYRIFKGNQSRSV
jgi:hypothetical protein